MELLNEHSANKIILKNKFCNETLLQENNEKISTINIDEIGPCEFMCFEEKDVEIMKKYYRIICNFSTEFQNSSKFSPIVMLPEQVQILLENGFAIVRRVKTIISDDNSVSTQFFNSFSVDEQILNDNNEELVMLARKVALGRRIKDIKRKRYGSEASSTNLKVCKIDNKTFENEISKFITEAEVKSIAHP